MRLREVLDARYIGSAKKPVGIYLNFNACSKPHRLSSSCPFGRPQLVYYNADENVDQVMEKGCNQGHSLTAWFKNKSVQASGQLNTLYQNFPRLGFMIKKIEGWKAKKKGSCHRRM